MPMERLAVAALLLVASATAPAAAGAQMGLEPVYERPQLMVGYVANAPQMFMGGMIAFIPRQLGGWGIHVDAKRSISSPADDEFFTQDITYDEAENQLLDIPRGEASYWRSFNAAVVKALRADVIVYAGGGMAEGRRFTEFYDSTGELGNFGHYWVEDVEAGGWHPNLMAGMYFRLMRHVAVQFGVESAPQGLSVGVLGVF